MAKCVWVFAILVFGTQLFGPAQSTSAVDLLAVPIAQQLNDAIGKVKSLGENIAVLEKNLGVARTYTEKAKTEVETLVSQAKSSVNNYKVYVTLAVNVANDVEKPNCSVGSSEEVREVETSVSGKIDSSAQYYIASFAEILTELNVVRDSLVSKDTASIIAILNSCLKGNGLRLDLVSRCIQWNAAAYKELIVTSSVKIAAAYNKALFLKKTTGLKVLKSSIDTTVSLSSNDIKNYAEEILECSGMSATAIFNTAAGKFDAVNASSNAAVQISIVDLKDLIKQTQNKISVSSSGAEPKLKELVVDIETAITFILKYKPELASELNIYRGRAQEIVSGGLIQLQTGLSQIRSGLDQVSANIDAIYVDFLAKINQSKLDLQACIPSAIEDRLTWTKTIMQCTDKQLNLTAEIANNAKLQIANEKNKYFALDSNANSRLDFNIEFSNIKPSVDKVIEEMLVKSGLAEQLLLAEAQNKLSLSTKNQSDSLSAEIDNLKNSIATSSSGLSGEFSKANTYKANIDKLLNQATNFAANYAPEYRQRLNEQSNLAQQLIVLFKNTAEPVLNQLQAISINIGNVLTALKDSQENVKQNLKTCLANESQNRFSYIDYVIACLQGYQNSADALEVNAKQQLTVEIEKFNSLPDVTPAYQTNEELLNVFNNVENIIEDIIVKKNLGYDQMVERAKLKIESFNASYGSSITVGSKNLSSSIVNSQTELKGKITSAEQLLSELVIFPIASSVRYSVEYAPDKASELKTFYLLSNEMLNNYISKIKSDALPYQIQFQSILDQVKILYPNLQLQLQVNVASLESCKNENGDGKIGKIEAVDACLKKLVNASEALAKNVQVSLSNQKDLYTGIGNVNVTVEEQNVKKAVDLTIQDVLRVAGLTTVFLFDKTQKALLDLKTRFATPIETGVNELKNSASSMQNQVLAEINNIDGYIGQILSSISNTIKFAEKYSPKSFAILNNYLNQTNDLVIKIKTDLTPINPRLGLIIETIADISINLNNKISESEGVANSCVENSNPNPLQSIQEVKLCLDKQINATISLAENTKLVLSEEYAKYNAITNLAAYVTGNLSSNLGTIFSKVNAKVDQIIQEEKLAPEVQMETNLQKLVALSQTTNGILSAGVDKLQVDIENTKTRLNSDSTQAELAFGIAVDPVIVAINYAKQYAPEKAAELNAFNARAEELVFGELLKVKSSVTPTITELDDISFDTSEIYKNLQNKIEIANKSLSACVSINDLDKLVRIESVSLCLSTHMDAATSATQEAEANLQKEVDRFNNIANTRVTVDVRPLKNEVATIVDNVFTAAGLNDADILKRAQEDLVTINNTRGMTLQVGVDSLTTSSTQTQTQIAVGITNTDKYLNNTVEIIKEAIQFANKYAPEKTTELDNYLTTVVDKANIAKSDFETTKPQVVSIINNIGVLTGDVQTQIKTTSNEMNLCANTNIVERVARAENIKQCVASNLDVTLQKLLKVEAILADELIKFNLIASIPAGISNNVSVSFNDTINQVEKVIDDIILSAGLSPESLLNKGVISLSSIFVNGNPQLATEDLHNSIIRYQNDIDAGIAQAEQTLKQLTSVNEIFDYAIQYAPDKTPELNELRAKKDKILEDLLNNIKNTQQPIKEKLQLILQNVDSNYNSFEEKYKQIELDVRACNVSIEDDIDRTEAINTCVNNNLELAKTAVNEIQRVLAQQISEFNNLGNINISVDLTTVNADLKTLTDKAFEVAGLLPQLLLEKKLQELLQYNLTVTTALQNGITNLSVNIVQTQDELTATLTGADKYLQEVIVNSTLAIDFATKYAPTKITDFQGYITEAQKLFLQAKTDIQPAKIQLQSIQSIINTIYDDLLTRLNQTQVNLLSCPRSNSFDTLSALLTFQNCLKTNFEVSIEAGNTSQTRLAEEVKKFDLIDNISLVLNETLKTNLTAIDTSVIETVEEVIVTFGLTPEALKNKGLNQVENVNVQVSDNLLIGVNELVASVNNTLKQIDTGIANGEILLNRTVRIIENAINYAIEYNPEKLQELESFRGKASEIVKSVIESVSNGLVPVQNKLLSVIEDKDNILINFQAKIEEVKLNISLCANDNTVDKFAKIENIQQCVNNYLTLIVNEANTAQHVVYEKYEKLKTIGSIAVNIDTNGASSRAAEVVLEILTTAGLTIPQLEGRTYEKIASINESVSGNLLDGINKLKIGVSSTQDNTNKALQTAEQYLINTTKYIEEAKEFVQRHSPNRLPELENLLNQAQQILTKIKSDVQPSEAQLLAIFNTADLIFNNFQLQVDGTKASVKSCRENTNANQLEQVISIRNCLNSYVNTIISAANNANGQLNNEIKKFNVVSETAFNATVNLYPDFVGINAAVKEIIDQVVTENQLKPNFLYERTVNELTSINTTVGVNVKSGIDNLKSAVIKTNADIDDAIAKIRNQLNEAVQPIVYAVQELVKYAPEKSAEILAFKARAEEIIANTLSNVQGKVQPTRTLLQSIFDSLDGIYTKLQIQLEQSKSNIDYCYANQKQNEIENIKYLEECFNKEVNVTVDVSNNRQAELRNEYNRYNSIGNITLAVTVDFGTINVNVGNTVDELRRISGLTPEALLNSTKLQLDVILSNNGSNVRNDIVSILNYVAARQNDVTAAARTAEIQIKQEVQPIENAINFAGKYSPEKLAQLNNFLNSANELVISNINKINADILPSLKAFTNISVKLNSVLDKYEAEIIRIKEDLITCIAIQNPDSYENIPVIQQCLKNYIDQTNQAIATAQESLLQLRQEFANVSNTASFVVSDIDLGQFTTSVQEVITEIFDNAGFTLPDLPQKLVTELENEFNIEVADDKVKSQELTNDVIIIAEKYVDSFNGTLDWSLEPIKNAIETIKYVNPKYDTSALSNQWQTLHDQLRGTIINYIRNIQKNTTDNNLLAVNYNLNVEFALLRQNLDNCVATYTKAYLPYISDCIDPLVREFTTYINNALIKTKAIINEIEKIKITAPRLIEEFINKTAENARQTAVTVGEDGKIIAAIKPDEQIKRFVADLDALRKNGINVIISEINSLIKNVKNGNLTAFIDLNAKLDKAAEPWLYAINISLVNNPAKAAILTAQLPLIQKIVEDAKLRVRNELAPFILDATTLEVVVKLFQTGMNTNLTKFNTQLILSRCARFNYSATLFSDCIRNVTLELNNYLSIVQPQLNTYLDSANNISATANNAISSRITIEFNATQLLSLNEGGKVIQAYNISNNDILSQSLQNFKTYNITPIQHNIRSLRSYAERIGARTQDMLAFANYTLRSATYVINDAIGSVVYIIKWKKTFNEEREEGLRIATAAANQVLATVPNFTEDILRIEATANILNNTLELEVSKLEPAQLVVTCPMDLEFYGMYQCLFKKVEVFGAYYTPALRQTYQETNRAFAILLNDTVQLNRWRDDVIQPETAAIVHLMKPVAQQLYQRNNITIDQLLGYALYITNNTYKNFNPAIPNAAINLKKIANRILAKNYTGRVDLTEPANILLKPITDTLAYFRSANVHLQLNETDLRHPQILFDELNYKLYNVFYANFSIQAQLAINRADFIQLDVQTTHNDLNYDFFFNNCYDPEVSYPLVEMVNCYNTRHAAFSVYLTNSMKNLTTTASTLLGFDINEQKIVSDYVNGKLLPEFKQIVALAAIELYRKVGLPAPAEYIAMVAKQELCRIGIITDKFTCIITQ